MAENLQQITITMLAGLDLSAWQHRFVRFSGDYVVRTLSAGGVVNGILLNKPDAKDKSAEVLIFGIGKIVTDGTVAIGDFIFSDASGRGDVIAPTGILTAQEVAGWALQTDGAAGSKVDIMFNRMTAGK